MATPPPPPPPPPRPRLKHLEAALSSLPVSQRDFPNPSVDLEQYPTSSHLTACVVQLAASNPYNDLGPGNSCLDLGCGTGMLTLGAALVGTDTILAVDCDPIALARARENVEGLFGREEVGDDDDEDGGAGMPVVDYILAKVLMKKVLAVHKNNQSKGKRGSGAGGRSGRGGGRGGRGSQPSSTTKARIIRNGENGSDGIPLQDDCVDTVLSNPPFGTKAQNAGIDLQFLRTATRLARKSVYSFHKRSTRSFLLKTIQDDWGYPASVVAEMSFDVKQMYQFHKLKSKDIEVDLIRTVVLQEDDRVVPNEADNADFGA